MSEHAGIPRQRATTAVRKPGRLSTLAASGGHGAWSLGDALDRIELFDCLDKETRRQLITGAQPRHYQRGELLYAEGEASEEILVMMSGAAVLFRSTLAARRATLAAVRSPGVLGEEALAGRVPRSASAEALTGSFALALPESELASVMRRHPAMGDAARRWLAFKLDRLAEQRADDILLDLPTRVAKTIVELAERNGASPLALDLSQAVVASLARGSRQSVNQTLKRFADRGWLRMERNRILIVDRAALARRSGQPTPRTGTRTGAARTA